ncbi:hypothetical protein [Thalassospira tepidiphila]|uniref:Acyl-CoA reductase-like NAD-dependent aldehyde dehydrogenase n=1 Tax=Thalassospira tepidiphila TaxID=393657 RepID=A0ABX0WZ52_9PROT|nr:hypothetical protein [Thalassospira tepidiphila]NJB74597.1 acyl-CoA reductase-like NAD-dependent aldehyde dehydrogenase [Thalassospira tepidiphila]
MSETHEEVPENEVGAVVETLKGDYSRAVCDWFRNAPKTWQEMSEDEQKEFIARLSEHTENLIGQAIRAIARQGRTVIEAKLDQVTIKDGIKGVVTMSQHAEDRHALYDAQGLPVLIVVAGSKNQYTGGDMPQPEPDQPDMIGDGQPDLGDEQPEFPEENEAA